ncbi:MAG: hypothetical protein A3J24_06205 [Deltaproteobacteria bacterium RIFCSPLOWO2_02_FULL_53_8]|nr:MAG: hypothetical protein A3J24_06205 [Deltaproteobacteria bacterium RIFCSPLOWO2_02_FULL_53_8]
MEFVNLYDKIDFEAVFVPRILRIKPEYKVPLICMEPGQEIKPHQSGTGVFYVVQGCGIMTVEDKEIPVKAGNMIFVEKGESRGFKATSERLVAFAVHMG